MALANGKAPCWHNIWSTMIQCRIRAAVFAELRRCAVRVLCSATGVEIMLRGKTVLVAFCFATSRPAEAFHLDVEAGTPARLPAFALLSFYCEATAPLVLLDCLSFLFLC
mmetsp:Transcript_41125/g.87040  ORF Transcript_41125/g.87040 Transcript_41125/m.87040 type:complete len:110 (+) Transcript_41125:162-491(+)